VRAKHLQMLSGLRGAPYWVAEGRIRTQRRKGDFPSSKTVHGLPV